MELKLLGTRLEHTRNTLGRIQGHELHNNLEIGKILQMVYKQEPENVRFKGAWSTRAGIMWVIQSHFSFIIRYKRGRLEGCELDGRFTGR